MPPNPALATQAIHSTHNSERLKLGQHFVSEALNTQDRTHNIDTHTNTHTQGYSDKARSNALNCTPFLHNEKPTLF